MASPEYSPPGPSTVDNLEKTDAALNADIHKQEIRNIVASQRSVFDTQFENYVSNTFNEATPQSVLDGVTIDFLCDGNVTAFQNLPPNRLAVWTPATSIMANLIENGYYLIAILMNVKPSNEVGELLINMIDIPATLPPLFLGNSGIENQVQDQYDFNQTVMTFLIPTAAVGLDFKFQVTPLGMNVDLAEREIQITRTM